MAEQVKYVLYCKDVSSASDKKLMRNTWITPQEF